MSILTDPKSTPIDNLYKQGQIKNRVVCIKLNEIDDENGGELIVGGCDVEAEHWVPVLDTGFWQINLTKVEIITPDGLVKATYCDHPRHSCTAILDTGTNVLSKIIRFMKTKRKKTFESF